MNLKYDPNNKETYFYVDDQFMILGQNRSWNPDGDGGKGDSIGKTMKAYFTYEDPRLVEAIKRCWHKVDDDGDYYYKGYRYPIPELVPDDLSRDHTLNTLLALKLANDPFLYELSTHLKWRISKRFTFTPDLWCWRGMIGSNNKIKRNGFGFLYYFMSIFIAIANLVVNKTIYKIAGFKEEQHQDDFEPWRPQDLTKKELKWRKKLYPMYSLEQVGWQLFVLKNHPIKRLLQLIYRPLIGRYNYFLKLLFNVGEVKKDDVINYKTMYSWRWGVMLNKTTDRSLRIIEKPEYLEANNLEKDILIKIWNYRNKNNKI